MECRGPSWTVETAKRRRKGACFAWNDGNCGVAECHFDHVCSRCHGGHRRSACGSGGPTGGSVRVEMYKGKSSMYL